jgi:phosphatidylserine/phosphatidylglycerophosphate/cardiolipin synthase-like enzyme
MDETEIVINEEIYRRVIVEGVPRARRFLWIGTSDIKDLHVHKGRGMVPFLEILSDLLERNVSIRLIHAKEPGPAFRRDFDRYENLIGGIERILCPRVHFKCIVIDGRFAYTGSANLTGAGMGAKSPDRRNFETGIVTTNPEFVRRIMDQFDSIWMGKQCGGCKRKQYCADYREMMIESED